MVRACAAVRATCGARSSQVPLRSADRLQSIGGSCRAVAGAVHGGLDRALPRQPRDPASSGQGDDAEMTRIVASVQAIADTAQD